jgi:hypothetical protein
MKKKIRLGIVKDPVVMYETVSHREYEAHIRHAAWNMYNNPQENFDRGLAAMIQAYKEIGPFDYVALIGKGSLPDVVLSSQNFFCQEVEGKFNAAGINISVESIAATSNKFCTDEIIGPIERNSGIGINDMERKSIQISQGKAYRYYFGRFNYDENVAVYKFTKK